MKKFLLLGVGTFSLLVPAVVFAQDVDVTYIVLLIGTVNFVIEVLLPLLMALTVLFIFYGLAKMAFSAGNEEARKEGRQYAIWGVIALVIMVGLYALVAIVQGIFGLDGGPETISAPTLPSSTGGSSGAGRSLSEF